MRDLHFDISEISVFTLKEWIEKDQDFLILDVREPEEFEICNMSGLLIPLGQIVEKTSMIPLDKKIVVVCHHGFRSRQAVLLLTKMFDYKNVYNLTGGIHRWAKEVDREMAVY